MIGQLSFGADGQIKDKVERSIECLRAFEPPDGYYVAFSGGKDSQCVYHLCQIAGVKFDAHYAVTSVDPPELVQFIKSHYPDAWEGRYHARDKDGKPYTMWNLIVKHSAPPTRIQRFCCKYLKETGGEMRRTVTGVRWAESANRKISHGQVTIKNPSKKDTEEINAKGLEYATDKKHGGIILNYDNDDSRQVLQTCIRTRKILVNPIIDWDESDVWEFLNSNNIEHCCLYDEGFTRLGCIGCPMGGGKQIEREFDRWSRYRSMYLTAFGKMLKKRKEKGKETLWQTPEEVMDWWINGKGVDDGETLLDDLD